MKNLFHKTEDELIKFIAEGVVKDAIRNTWESMETKGGRYFYQILEGTLIPEQLWFLSQKGFTKFKRLYEYLGDEFLKRGYSAISYHFYKESNAKKLHALENLFPTTNYCSDYSKYEHTKNLIDKIQECLSVEKAIKSSKFSLQFLQSL